MAAGRPISSYFLGPQAENEAWAREAFERILGDWFAERRGRFPDDLPASAGDPAASAAGQRARRSVDAGLGALVTRLREELPTYTPRYLGHMASELALPGLLGHVAAVLHNPNNTSREASRVGTQIEAEAIARLAHGRGRTVRVTPGVLQD